MITYRIKALSRVALHCYCSNSLLNANVQRVSKYSFRCVTVDSQGRKQTFNKEKEKVRMYLVQRYIDYVKNYTKVLEKRFPTAMNMYRVFSVGIKDFLRDLKTYVMLRMKMSKDRGFSKMSRQDIELCQKMPRDMLKIAPVLILSAVPFGNYVIFPLAFLKPRMLLCSHFWSIQQRADFTRQDLTERLKNNKPVFRALQAKLDDVPYGSTKIQWKRVLALMGSGVHPTPCDIIACKELFVGKPYHLSELTYTHKGHLLKMHGYRKGLFRTNKLKYRAFMLLEMDKAILREGGVDTLSTDELRNACLIRGLNSTHLSNQGMKTWLTYWLLVSKQLDKNYYSLLLHCPIFLAYNHPQNWKLVYKKTV